MSHHHHHHHQSTVQHRLLLVPYTSICILSYSRTCSCFIYLYFCQPSLLQFLGCQPPLPIFPQCDGYCRSVSCLPCLGTPSQLIQSLSQQLLSLIQPVIQSSGCLYMKPSHNPASHTSQSHSYSFLLHAEQSHYCFLGTLVIFFVLSTYR